ncbi:hypothetical protein M409DRAFT_56583 [Zasmidium cellare ATCC 36951]|uniref:Uncharacterized protein n=1 Tax=Zasmidium cellare ATCC 36951 TaxID=1080233 RepID=A0A6A6CB85_ZASCE|nr:uncharacterized protein M409DRAFT_56583 [Zasmidium cellare ATCC 36951]KAF2164301.1 hypothetical protein M409DRAFT_56583 [Zasmidium cellare ATCC 36951]
MSNLTGHPINLRQTKQYTERIPAAGHGQESVQAAQELRNMKRRNSTVTDRPIKFQCRVSGMPQSQPTIPNGQFYGGARANGGQAAVVRRPFSPATQYGNRGPENIFAQYPNLQQTIPNANLRTQMLKSIGMNRPTQGLQQRQQPMPRGQVSIFRVASGEAAAPSRGMLNGKSGNPEPNENIKTDNPVIPVSLNTSRDEAPGAVEQNAPRQQQDGEHVSSRSSSPGRSQASGTSQDDTARTLQDNTAQSAQDSTAQAVQDDPAQAEKDDPAQAEQDDPA